MKKFIQYIPIVKDIVMFVVEVYRKAAHKHCPHCERYDDIPHDPMDDNFPHD